MIKGQIAGVEDALVPVKAFPARLERQVGKSLLDLVLEAERRVASQLAAQGLEGMTVELSHRFAVRNGKTIAAVVEAGRAAAYQEFGFHGEVSVADQVRQVRQAFGQAIRPREVMVAAHSRREDYGGRPFLGPALGDMGGRIHDLAEQALEAVQS